MSTRPVILTLQAVILAAVPALAAAQTFDAVGSRAAGMGGAFVAVADDASAAYWNPAGFAAGSIFSLVLDRTAATAEPELGPAAGSQSGFLAAIGMPALGLSYYRTRASWVHTPTAEVAGSRNVAGEVIQLDNLVTHHAGVTLVQSVAQGVAVGTTLKLVRGVAGSQLRVGDTGDLLPEASTLIGRASNRFDADLGLMIGTGRMKAGLTVRNLLEPEFETPDGLELGLERQARAGVALMPVPGWLVAADLDLLTVRGPAGDDRRDLAVGAEGRVGRRAVVRAGTRFDTRADGPGERAATVSAGGSYVVMAGIYVDAQVTLGSRWGGRGWGVGARFVY